MERVQKEAVKIGTTAIGSTVSGVINVCATNTASTVASRSSNLSMILIIALLLPCCCARTERRAWGVSKE